MKDRWLLKTVLLAVVVALVVSCSLVLSAQVPTVNSTQSGTGALRIDPDMKAPEVLVSVDSTDQHVELGPTTQMRIPQQIRVFLPSGKLNKTPQKGVWVVTGSTMTHFSCSDPTQFVVEASGTSGWACKEAKTGLYLLNAAPPTTIILAVPDKGCGPGASYAPRLPQPGDVIVIHTGQAPKQIDGRLTAVRVGTQILNSTLGRH